MTKKNKAKTEKNKAKALSVAFKEQSNAVMSEALADLEANGNDGHHAQLYSVAHVLKGLGEALWNYAEEIKED